MFLPDLVIRGRRVIVDDRATPAALHIRGGKIVGILEFDDVPAGCLIDDAGDPIVMPGLVDTQVHVLPEPEAFEAVTRAAAAGGVTTIVDTVVISDSATTPVRALDEKKRAATGHSFVDVGFWGGVTPGSVSALPALVDAGVFGFACALASPDGSETAVSESDLRAAMPIITELDVPLLVRADLPGPAAASFSDLHPAVRRLLARIRAARRGRRYDTYLAAKPKEDENRAVALLIELCRAYRTQTHLVSLSSSDTLTPIYQARAARVPLSAGTCPHYLHFVAEEIANGAKEFRCTPPIRGRENREFLWAALGGGLIQTIASDHRPSPPGISSLPFGLAATWTRAHAQQCSAVQLANWMCRAPARLAGLDRKGAIQVGYDADLVVWDPDAEFTAGEGNTDRRRPRTPYANRRLRGLVERTYLRGACVYNKGPMPTPHGRVCVRQGLAAVRSTAAGWRSAAALR